MQNTYIYAVKGVKGQVVCVGKSNDPARRFKEHLRGSGNAFLAVLLEERGEDDFSLEILEKVGCNKEFWKPREQFWIKKFKRMGCPLCNMNEGGGGPTQHSQEVLNRMRENHPKQMLGRRHTKKARERMRIAKQKYFETHDGTRKGVTLTLETRARMSESKRGQAAWNKGIPRSEECKRKISISRRASGVHKGNVYGAKPYPAFVNDIMGQYIPAGVNLQQMCREQEMVYANMYSIKYGAVRVSRDGWGLA